MTVFIDKKPVTKKKKQAIDLLTAQKGFNPAKYLGKIKNWEGAKTGLEYQKNIRNEW
jgi:predicted DNA-binding protein (MmcQ/YjbR family)